jgi:hypothetical protein
VKPPLIPRRVSWFGIDKKSVDGESLSKKMPKSQQGKSEYGLMVDELDMNQIRIGGDYPVPHRDGSKLNALIIF